MHFRNARRRISTVIPNFIGLRPQNGSTGFFRRRLLCVNSREKREQVRLSRAQSKDLEKKVSIELVQSFFYFLL